MPLEKCIGCGGEFEPELGPVHSYMTSSPACWAAFGRILAAEYSDPRLMPAHRFSVDAFAVQHPGNSSRQAIQSVGLHLARLHFQLERNASPADANAFMLRVAARKAELPRLTPLSSFKVTTAQVQLLAGTSKHESAVREWAQSAWDDWASAHEFIKHWAAKSLA
jgi:hypothetical protein